MKDIAVKIISNLFHPLVSMPWAFLVILLFTPISLLPPQTEFFLFGEVLLFSTLLPCLFIYLLSKCGVVKNGMALRDRKDRVIPLLVQFLLCSLQVAVLQKQGLPSWSIFCFWGGGLLTLVFFIVTFWWKISGHAAGNASLTITALILFFLFPNIVPSWLLITTILITGAVSSIRVYLHRHTMSQVAVGALAGAMSMLIAFFVVC